MSKSIKIILLFVLVWEIPDVLTVLLPPLPRYFGLAREILFFLLIPSVIVALLIRKDVIPLSQTGLLLPVSPVFMYAGLLLCFLSAVLVVYVTAPLLHLLLPESFFRYYRWHFPAEQPCRAIAMVYYAGSAAVIEEIVCRGIITTEIEKHCKSVAKTTFLSCLIFGGLHWHYGLGGALEVAAWAIIPTLWFLKRRTVWSTMAGHFVYNMWVFVNYSS